MKIPCQVNDKPAVIVGFYNGKKNKAMAVVITQGALCAVRFKEIVLGNLSEELRANVVTNLREAS